MSVLHHLALRTPDIARLAHHYQTACGLARLEERPNGSVWLAAGPTVLMLEQRDDDEAELPVGSLELLAFRLERETLAQAATKLEKLGIEIEARSEFTLYFRDPDGRRNGLSNYPLPPRLHA